MTLPAPLDLLPTLAEGIGVTLQLLVGGAAVALVAGLAAGVGRSLRTVTWLGRPSPAARLGRSAWYGAATAYVEVFRGTSALVQLFWVYFALPRLGVSMTALGAGILVLGLNTGSYGAEVVRGAVQAVPKGQREAARALGLSEAQILRRVVLPQAAARMVPPAGNLLIELLKNTALASTIALTELTFRAQALRSETLRTVEIFSVTLVVYFVIAQAISFAMGRIEKRLAVGRA
ncbi:MAG TPA: ectoine/hydroxyectoine ABC transporter permease subunit EhuC [Thermoanaerobaculia bacterium]